MRVNVMAQAGDSSESGDLLEISGPVHGVQQRQAPGDVVRELLGEEVVRNRVAPSGDSNALQMPHEVLQACINVGSRQHPWACVLGERSTR